MLTDYPYAASPDIIRSKQKDADIVSVLRADFTNVLQQYLGSSMVHRLVAETRLGSELLYHCLTTLVGNRTLGEEYCDIHQIEGTRGRLPSLARRAAYIFGSILVPYGLEKLVPALRRRLRRKLEQSLSTVCTNQLDGSWRSRRLRVQAFLLDNIDTITSAGPIYAVSLAAFYLSGAYLHLSKRLLGLRYIFSRTLAPHEKRSNYEVLGVLLALQLTVQAYMSIRESCTAILATGEKSDDADSIKGTDRQTAAISGTDVAVGPVHDLADAKTMPWLQPSQQRKCTLCLDPMKDPAVTTCGHMYCWACIQDWIREKPECALCRQSILLQHVLPLQG